WDAETTSSSGKGPRANSHFYIGGDGSSASDTESQNKYLTVTSVFLYHRILTREEAAKVGASNLALPESISGKMLEGPDDPAGTGGGSKDGNASQLTNNTFLKKGFIGYGTVRVRVCLGSCCFSFWGSGHCSSRLCETAGVEPRLPVEKGVQLLRKTQCTPLRTFYLSLLFSTLDTMCYWCLVGGIRTPAFLLFFNLFFVRR
ncbi:trans-sialidase, putative, partial [Trypanosoma cruzi]